MKMGRDIRNGLLSVKRRMSVFLCSVILCSVGVFLSTPMRVYSFNNFTYYDNFESIRDRFGVARSRKRVCFEFRYAGQVQNELQGYLAVNNPLTNLQLTALMNRVRKLNALTQNQIGSLDTNVQAAAAAFINPYVTALGLNPQHVPNTGLVSVALTNIGLGADSIFFSVDVATGMVYAEILLSYQNTNELDTFLGTPAGATHRLGVAPTMAAPNIVTLGQLVNQTAVGLGISLIQAAQGLLPAPQLQQPQPGGGQQVQIQQIQQLLQTMLPVRQRLQPILAAAQPQQLQNQIQALAQLQLQNQIPAAAAAQLQNHLQTLATHQQLQAVLAAAAQHPHLQAQIQAVLTVQQNLQTAQQDLAAVQAVQQDLAAVQAVQQDLQAVQQLELVLAQPQRLHQIWALLGTYPQLQNQIQAVLTAQPQQLQNQIQAVLTAQPQQLQNQIRGILAAVAAAQHPQLQQQIQAILAAQQQPGGGAGGGALNPPAPNPLETEEPEEDDEEPEGEHQDDKQSKKEHEDDELKSQKDNLNAQGPVEGARDYNKEIQIAGAKIKELTAKIEKAKKEREDMIQKGTGDLAEKTNEIGVLEFGVRVVERGKTRAEFAKNGDPEIGERLKKQTRGLEQEVFLGRIGLAKNKEKVNKSKSLQEFAKELYKLDKTLTAETTSIGAQKLEAASGILVGPGGVPAPGTPAKPEDKEDEAVDEAMKWSEEGEMPTKASAVYNSGFIANMIRSVASDNTGEEVFEGIRRVISKKGEGEELKKVIVWAQGSYGHNSYKEEEKGMCGEYKNNKIGGTIGVNGKIGGEEGSGFVLGGFAKVVSHEMKQEGKAIEVAIENPACLDNNVINSSAKETLEKINSSEKKGEATSGVVGINLGYVTPRFEVMMMAKGDLTKYKVKGLAAENVKEVKIDGKGVGGEIEGRWKIKAGEGIEIVPKIGIEGTVENYDRDEKKNIEKGDYGRCIGKAGVELGIGLGESNKIKLRGVYKLLIKGEKPKIKVEEKTLAEVLPVVKEEEKGMIGKGIEEGKHMGEIGIGWECKASEVVVLYADVKYGIAERFKDIQAKLGVGFKF